ncbi:major facilitator superfamily transporter [Sarocladium strictum]
MVARVTVHERTPLLNGRKRDSSTSSTLSSLTSSSISDTDTEDHDYYGFKADSKVRVVHEPDVENLAAGPSPKLDDSKLSTSVVIRLLVVLVIGAFTVNADGSLVLVTSSRISSEFNALHQASWLFTAFVLGGCATQALYGRLSDVIGSRILLLTSYFLFAVGCTFVGSGQNMWHVIVGRVISGFGSSAMAVASALTITNMLPLRDVAASQAGLNLAGTIGRTLGAPLGGVLADTIGWRWSFLGQAPVFCFGLLLCAIYIPKHVPRHKTQAGAPQDLDAEPAGLRAKLADLDIPGASLIAACILTSVMAIEVGGRADSSWRDPVWLGLVALSSLSGIFFYLTESRWARKPIFPLELLREMDISATYMVACLQTAAQLGLMFAVPLYFQVTERASNTVAGARLTPAVVGNAFGGILAGVLVKRTGRYKKLMVCGSLSTFVSYLLLLARWHGRLTIWETFYIIPAGFGTGISQGATFISLQAAVSPQLRGPATAGLFLALQIGMIFGLAGVNAIIMQTMRHGLDTRLAASGIEPLQRLEIIERASSSVDYLGEASPLVAEAMSAAYIEGISNSHFVSLICSLIATFSASRVRDQRLA